MVVFQSRSRQKWKNRGLKKKRLFLFVVVFAILTTIACGISTGIPGIPNTGQGTSTPAETSTITPPSGCTLVNNPDLEARLLALINQERTQRGLPQVEPQEQLKAAATEHTIEMACNAYFDHVGINGDSPFDRIENQGYAYSVAGEDLYVGSGRYNTPEQAVQSWLESQGHREVLLYPDFTQVGISYRYNPNTDYGGYYTAVFAHPHD